MELLRITAPHFVAGCLIDAFTDIVACAAPIIRWTVGKKRIEVLELNRKPGWSVDSVS